MLIDDPDELHHLIHVLRLKAGDEVELVNGQGLLAHGALAAVTKASAEVEVDRVEAGSRLEVPRIVLACALPKKAKFELILEKATELGVDEIVPLVTERTEAVIAQDSAKRKHERFFKVVLNACKQSKRLWFPQLHPVTSFQEALASYASPSNRLFIPWLGGERVLINTAMERVRSERPSKIVFFIGPEGDFTPDEVSLAVKAGAQPLDLGETVLKVDTAAVAVLAYARFMVGDA
jgi:16S rRNA (uracil1498-N3)-methyltransferase